MAETKPASTETLTKTNKKTEHNLNPAGPHAKPELTDSEKTPGCGVLPEAGEPNQSPTG